MELKERFYKNVNKAQIWPKIKNNARTIQAGIWNHKSLNAKFTFLNKILILFSSKSTVSSVEILIMLRSIESYGLVVTSKAYLEYFRNYGKISVLTHT